MRTSRPSTPANKKEGVSTPRSGMARFAALASPENDMLGMKLNRKRAETDLQLIANRIALLKAEEQKALNKVVETKIRAEEIIDMKRRNEEATKQRLQASMNKELAARSVQQKALLDKVDRQKKLAQSIQLYNDVRLKNADAAKLESRSRKESINNSKLLSEMEKRAKVEEEKNRYQDTKMAREREKAEKEDLNRRAYAAKMSEEAERKKEADDMILILENEEKLLIERLRESQERQKEAYNLLQKSLEI